jgi:hypothetical protein
VTRVQTQSARRRVRGELDKQLVAPDGTPAVCFLNFSDEFFYLRMFGLFGVFQELLIQVGALQGVVLNADQVEDDVL